MASNKLNKAKLLERIKEASAAEVNAIKESYDKAGAEYAAAKEAWQKDIKAWMRRHIDDAEFTWNPPDDPTPREPQIRLEVRGRYECYTHSPEALAELISREEKRRDEALRYVELIDGDTVTVANNEYPPFRFYL